MKKKFKEFLQRIIDSENKWDAMDSVFYGTNGIDQVFQKGQLTWEEHQMLLHLIRKMA